MYGDTVQQIPLTPSAHSVQSFTNTPPAQVVVGVIHESALQQAG